MTNQNNIFTEEEIKELIGNLNWNPNRAEITNKSSYRLLLISPLCLKTLRGQRI